MNENKHPERVMMSNIVETFTKLITIISGILLVLALAYKFFIHDYHG